MASDWDTPQKALPASQDAFPRAGVPAADGTASSRGDGLLDPLAALGWLMRNWLRIAAITVLLTVIGLVAVRLVPFPYSASAIVLADPRDQRITLQEEVLPSIGTDAAVLESMVQIVHSDGFLLEAMRGLGLIPAGDNPAGSPDELQKLADFRRNLNVERRGATYLVEISYRAPTGAEAARIANGVANAFAESQNRSRREATENAARALSQQLIELRTRLTESEQAVAKFKADNGIIYVDQNNTLQLRQLTDLNQQLALATNATEDARARYDELRNGGAVTRSGQNDTGSAQLSFLRQQRAQLVQARDQQTQIYGPRHPRMVQTQEAIAGIDRQIAQEQRLVESQLKADLDVAVARQAQLQRQIDSLSSDVTLTDAARVQLDALEREAAANRDVYQQMLARNKATDQLALLSEDNVRVVSAAVAPLRSTRPSTTLLLPVLAFLSFVLATTLTVAANFNGLRRGKGAGIAPVTPRRAPADAPGRPAPGAAESRPGWFRRRRNPETQPAEAAAPKAPAPQEPGTVAAPRSLLSDSGDRKPAQSRPATENRSLLSAAGDARRRQALGGN